jgi:hypothetical protein
MSDFTKEWIDGVTNAIQHTNAWINTAEQKFQNIHQFHTIISHRLDALEHRARLPWIHAPSLMGTATPSYGPPPLAPW